MKFLKEESFFSGTSDLSVENDFEKNKNQIEINKKIGLMISRFKNKTGDQGLFSDEEVGKIDWSNFLEETKEIYESNSKENIDRAWSQDQVDFVFEVLNKKSEEIGNVQLSLFLFNFFTTNQKDQEEDSTVSDLFVKSIINQIEIKGGINHELMSAINTWAQNIHMVNKDILMDFLLSINNHSEKIDHQDRYEICLGVGLSDSLIDGIINRYSKIKDVSSKLKILNVFSSIKSINSTGFDNSSRKALDFIEKDKIEEDNYFLKSKIESISEENYRQIRHNNLRIRNKYHDNELFEIGPKPLILEYNNISGYYENKVLSSYTYSRLNDNFGVIYNNAFEVDSFFDLNSGERVSLDFILNKEGFVSSEENPEAIIDIKTSYKNFISLPLRERVEDDFGVNLSEFNVREQLQFLNFVSSKSIEEVERVKNFMFQSQNDASRKDRFVSFLSMEQDKDMGEKILYLGDKFSKKPEALNLLFSKYSELSRSLDNYLKKFNDLYSESFFEKNIDDKKFIKAFFFRANNLISSSFGVVKDLSEDESEKKIGDLITELELEIKNKEENLRELSDTASKLNNLYRNLGSEVLRSLGGDSSDDFFGENRLEKIEEVQGKKMVDSLRDEIKLHKKFDSERILELITFYEESIEQENYSAEVMQAVYAEYNKIKKEKGEGGVENFSWQEKIDEYKEKYPLKESTKEQIIYSEALEKLKKVLPLQLALEKKMDKLVYGQESGILPAGFNDFEKSEVIPEEISEKAPLYFPVGISKDMPSWEEVLSGEKKAVKPIDVYGYLFWLNNQQRKVDLVVCDEIQTNNYKLRYDKSEEEAREIVVKIGAQETAQYQKIINTFGLKNISIKNYNEFIDMNREGFDFYRDQLNELKENSAFKEAFVSMVQDSVSGAEKEEYIGYALEELAWILSSDGTKIGHLNEARYDILGVIIRNWENIAKSRGIDIWQGENEESDNILISVCQNIRNIINEKKSKLDKKSSAFAYFQRLQDHLGKIKVNYRSGGDKSVKKNDLSINFACPDVGSASFGFRGDFKEKESVVKFKEPYSTYFYKDESDLLLNSDQVVVSDNGYIGGKILTLDSKKQIEYAQKVIQPIIKHYFAVLDNAPATYFEIIGKTKEDLLQEVKDNASLLDSLRFIKKYMVEPVQAK